MMLEFLTLIGDILKTIYTIVLSFFSVPKCIEETIMMSECSTIITDILAPIATIVLAFFAVFGWRIQERWKHRQNLMIEVFDELTEIRSTIFSYRFTFSISKPYEDSNIEKIVNYLEEKKVYLAKKAPVVKIYDEVLSVEIENFYKLIYIYQMCIQGKDQFNQSIQNTFYANKEFLVWYPDQLSEPAHGLNMTKKYTRDDWRNFRYVLYTDNTYEFNIEKGTHNIYDKKFNEVYLRIQNIIIKK